MNPRTFIVAFFFTTAAAAQEFESVADNAISNPSLTSAYAQPASQLTLSSTEDGTDLKAEAGFSRRRENGRWILGLRVQAPVQKGADETSLADLTGLASGGSGGIHFTRISYGQSFNPGAVLDICRERDNGLQRPPLIDLTAIPQQCTRNNIESLLQRWQATPEQKRSAYSAFKEALVAAARTTCAALARTGAAPDIRDIRCDLPEEILPYMQRADRRADRQRAEQGKASLCEDRSRLDPTCWEAQLASAEQMGLKTVCERLNTDPRLWGYLIEKGSCNSVKVKQLGRDWEDKLYDKLKLRPFYLGVSATAKNKSFTYAPLSILEEKTETKSEIALAANFGWYLVRSGWYVGAGATMERGYKGAKSGQFCEPVPDTNQTQCKTIARSAPTEENSEILQIEARRFIFQNIAINPRVNYDPDDSVMGYELISYLFSNEKKGLNGGINMGYRDDKDDLTVTVFIGLPFQLFGDPAL